MVRIKRAVGASVASLGLLVGLGGFAGAQSGVIDTTGPNSTNLIKSINRAKVRIHNDNNVNANNSNHQYSRTGEAEVEHNTTGGSAKSGNASNTNSFNANVSVSNAGAGSIKLTDGGSLNGSIKKTGPESYNKISSKNSMYVKVYNDNNLNVTNESCQTAKSGDAEVEGNTTGGSATSGNATNSNTSSLTVKISN